LVHRAGTTHQSFTWNGAYGYEWVPETGLYHVGAREYDPRTARWLQRNPIDAASVNPKLQCKGGWAHGPVIGRFHAPTGLSLDIASAEERG